MKKLIFFTILFTGLMSGISAASEKNMFERGVTLVRQERFQEAVDLFSELVERVPDNPAVYRYRGVALMKLGKYDLAIRDFEKARDIKPNLRGLYSNLGVAFYYTKDYSRAIENYNLAIVQKPDNHYAYFNRAMCRAELGEIGLSLDDVDESLRLFPGFIDAQCLKGDLYALSGLPLKAESAYEKAVAMDPDNSYAGDKLSRLRANIGGYEIQAGAFLKRVNAEKMLRKVKDKGYDVKIVRLIRSDGKTWHLVRIGWFDKKDAAEEAMKGAGKRTGIDLAVRQYGRF